MSAVASFQKQQVLVLVKQMMTSEEKLSAFNEKIERKLAEGVWKAREAEMQPELDRICELYKWAIEGYKANLMAQYDLEKKTFQQIEEVEDLLKVVEILGTFEMAMRPILEKHAKHAAEIKGYEDRISLFLPEGIQMASGK